MNNNVYINQTNIFSYDNNKYFNPSKKYPEGLNISIKSDEKIYHEVRNLLIDMKLDYKHIGKNNWNPFGDFIKENDTVVIKPNLVKHINENNVDGNTDSLITNFAIIRPIIDYTLLALNNTGKVIVGDAPVQECIFEEVIKLYNLKDGIEEYNKNGFDVVLKDFRKNNNENEKCTIVDLKSNSEFEEVDDYADKYAITNYNLKYMHQHHQRGKHEYLIADEVLNADVIINLPKPKAHRKAGMTACMKNFIGINSKKEYIPHHRNGSVISGGDEYPEKSLIKSFKSSIKNYFYTGNKILFAITKVLDLILKKINKARYEEGSWYGNDTIWRSILDINKIVLYSDKDGVLRNKIQRIVFNFADMIISGDKEGPLLPSNKDVGILVASFNSLNMDNSICQIMGFEPKKIKYIENGYNLKKYSISNSNNYTNLCKGKKINIKKYNKHFVATDGWVDYLNKNE